MADIKSAWNVFKKEIKKEGMDLTGCCYMTAKQLKNRTATICICNSQTYEEEIRHEASSMQRVLGFESWTDSEKLDSIKHSTDRIARLSERLTRYGNKLREYEHDVTAICESNAWKKFVEAAGGDVRTCYEENNNCMYLRIDF